MVNASLKPLSVVQIGPVPPPNGGVSSNMMAIHAALVNAGHRSTLIDVTDRSGAASIDWVIKPRSAFALIRFLAAADCDVVHYHIGGDFRARLALLTLFCGTLPGKKSVVTFHSGGWAEAMSDSATRFSLRGFAFRSVDRVIGVNQQMIDLFESYGVDRRRVSLVPPYDLRLPPGSTVLPPRVESFFEQGDPTLLAVGGLEKEYLNETLVGLTPSLLRKFPRLRIVIAGSGRRESILRALIAEMHLDESIMLAGNLEHDLMLTMMQKADAVLRLTAYDGDAISIREALFLGTPVVATDNGMRPAGVELVKGALNAETLLAAVSNALSIGRTEPMEASLQISNSERVVELYRDLVSG